MFISNDSSELKHHEIIPIDLWTENGVVNSKVQIKVFSKTHKKFTLNVCCYINWVLLTCLHNKENTCICVFYSLFVNLKDARSVSLYPYNRS